MNRPELTRQLHLALAHLYDHRYLESCPLASILHLSGRQHSGGQAMHQFLAELVEALKPADYLPRDSQPWRIYRYLVLRYIQLKNVAQTARELGVSDRQSQRIHGEAIEALAAVLWLQHSPTERVVTTQAESLPDAPVVKLAPDGRPIDEGEATRLAMMSTDRKASLANVVSSVLATIGKLATDRKVTISSDIPVALPPLAVERTVLRQALLSLLVASLHSGGRTLALVASSLSPRVELSVSVAVDSAHRGRRDVEADPLADQLRTRLREDRSLKVAIQLLEMQGGAVEIGEAEEGSVIRVDLPCVQPSTVLVVDDNPDTIRLLRRYLGGGAYSVLEATTGQRAVQLAHQAHPAAIILDVMMPQQDGWETLQTLRNHPDTAHIPVIICSVLDQRDLARSLGAADVLAKPVSRQALVHALESCLATPASRSD